MTPIYVEGALGRALRVTDGRTLVRHHEIVIADVFVPFDPFELFRLIANTGLRARLPALSQPELLGMIQQYDLNLAGKSLSRLTDSQLVTFIATAVEVQTIQGRK